MRQRRIGPTEIIVILVLAVDSLGPVLAFPVDLVYRGLLVFIVVIDAREVVECILHFAVLVAAAGKVKPRPALVISGYSRDK